MTSDAELKSIQAAERGDVQTLKTMLSNGYPISPDVVAWAAKNGHMETIASLCEAGFDVNQNNGQALRWAVASRKHECVIALLRLNADPNLKSDGFNPLSMRNEPRISPLDIACQNGDAKSLKILIEAGAKVGSKYDSRLEDAKRTGIGVYSETHLILDKARQFELRQESSERPSPIPQTSIVQEKIKSLREATEARKKMLHESFSSTQKTNRPSAGASATHDF